MSTHMGSASFDVVCGMVAVVLINLGATCFLQLAVFWFWKKPELSAEITKLDSLLSSVGDTALLSVSIWADVTGYDIDTLRGLFEDYCRLRVLRALYITVCPEEDAGIDEYDNREDVPDSVLCDLCEKEHDVFVEKRYRFMDGASRCSREKLTEWFYAEDERAYETLEDLDQSDSSRSIKRLTDKVSDLRDLLRECKSILQGLARDGFEDVLPLIDRIKKALH